VSEDGEHTSNSRFTVDGPADWGSTNCCIMRSVLIVLCFCLWGESFGWIVPPTASAAAVWRSNRRRGLLLHSPRSTLQDSDPELHELIKQESDRQRSHLNLIASENYASSAVLEALGSCLVNKYSEGYPGRRYYAGNAIIDNIETTCKLRAMKLFGLKDGEWCVNVQPYSGTPANFAVYTGLLEPGDTMLGLSLNCGGHLSHGHQTAARKVSATSKYFNCLHYGLDPNTELVDYQQLEEMARLHRPRLIVAGASAYSRDWDYSRIKSIAKSIGAYLMADIAHTAGLVATGLLNSPFQHCDVVTCTTQKSLRGPRAGLIFCRTALEKQINEAVFPGIQGGPHNNQIASVAVALQEALHPSYTHYMKSVVVNARALSDALMERGYKVLTNGTDNHIVLVSLKAHNVSAKAMEGVLERCGILVNRNTVVGDKSALNPTGIRMGTLAATTIGLTADDMKQVAQIFHEAVSIAKQSMNSDFIKNGINRLTDSSASDDSGLVNMLRPLRQKVASLLSGRA
jgi:glycine hydroxymethyltransferase